MKLSKFKDQLRSLRAVKKIRWTKMLIEHLLLLLNTLRKIKVRSILILLKKTQEILLKKLKNNSEKRSQSKVKISKKKVVRLALIQSKSMKKSLKKLKSSKTRNRLKQKNKNLSLKFSKLFRSQKLKKEMMKV